MCKTYLVAKLFIVGLLTISSFRVFSDAPLIPRSVLFGNPEKVYPSISPDGKKIAYSAPSNNVLNIWVKTIGTDDEKVVTHETKRGIYTFWWAFSGKQILYLQDTNGDENYHIFCLDLETNELRDLTPFPGVKAQMIARDKDFPNDAIVMLNKENPKLFDVYHLDLTTGIVTLIAKNPGNVSAWFADSQLQVRAAIATNNDGTQTLLVRDDNNAQWHSLLHVDFEDTLKDELYCGILGFSRDGKHLYINSSIDTDTRSLLKLNIMTGDRTIMATDYTYDITYVIFNTDTYEPEIVCWQKERFDYQVIDSFVEQDFIRMKAISSGDLFIQKGYDESKWILAFLHDNKSLEYYLYDRAEHHATFLFHARPLLNAYELAHMKPISFGARDGLLIHGYLTCPRYKEAKNLPLVLVVHGGPFYRDSWGYDPIVQWLANRGYACLQVNFRGSSGYGKQFLAAGNQEWGGTMQNDLIDAVQWAIDQEIADPNRLAIYGGSYGGYAALAGATDTPDLFCCAVDYCGPSNLITLLQTLPPYWSLAQWEKRIGKLEDEDFLKSRSPLFKIDAITIPIFVAHGANDVRVKQSESEQIVAAMKNKEIPYEYLLFSDEGHGFLRPENKFTFYTAVEKFLAKNLGGDYQE